MLEGSTGRALIHLRAINPHVIGLLTSRTLAGEHLPYLARQDGSRPTAVASTSHGSNAGVSAFAFQVGVQRDKSRDFVRTSMLRPWYFV